MVARYIPLISKPGGSRLHVKQCLVQHAESVLECFVFSSKRVSGGSRGRVCLAR